MERHASRRPARFCGVGSGSQQQTEMVMDDGNQLRGGAMVAPDEDRDHGLVFRPVALTTEYPLDHDPAEAGVVPAAALLIGSAREGRAQPRHLRDGHLRDGLRDAVKGGFDRLAAAVGIVILLPLLLVVAVAIYLRDPGPVLYAHRRIGRGGQVFRCLKFRTMVLNGDEVLARHLAENPTAAREWADSRKLRQDPRVTRLGARLRRSSIDELPQLINVLKGEMSLVGPRPIVLDEARHYGAALGDYLSVKPGLTGLWQISGRSDTSYAERVALDRRYVRDRGFWVDLGIILRTVAVVARGRGSY